MSFGNGVFYQNFELLVTCEWVHTCNDPDNGQIITFGTYISKCIILMHPCAQLIAQWCNELLNQDLVMSKVRDKWLQLCNMQKEEIQVNKRLLW